MRPLTFASLVVAVGALSSACSSNSTSPTPAPTSNAVTINILRQNGAQSFSPNPAQAGGKTVVFMNTDTITHRVILNDGSIDTGNIAPGATSGQFTMPSDGTNYHCSLHPAMVGSVSAASGAAPPACTGPYCEGY